MHFKMRSRLERNVGKYCQAATAAFETVATGLKDRLVKKYLPKWRQSPPSMFARHGIEPTDEDFLSELNHIVETTVQEAISFEAPQVRIVYKNVAHESVQDPAFRGPLEKLMQRRGVPIAVIKSLFAISDAAPATAAATRL